MKPDNITLKQRLADPKIVIAPGIHDALSALLAEQAGMEAVFLSGSAVAYSLLGRPDIGLVTMNEMADACVRISDRITIPILVDIDSGFGNAAHAARTVRVMEAAGANAVQVEDQIPVKADGDLQGRPLVSKAVMADKIKAMTDSRRSDDTLVSARSDAPFSEKMVQVLDRIASYREAGADIIFVEGLKKVSDVKDVVKAADGLPVVYNLLKSDGEILSAETLQDIGASIALFPSNAILSAANAMQAAFAGLAEQPALSAEGFPLSPADMNALLGTTELLAGFKPQAE